jgi:hypothetical protein
MQAYFKISRESKKKKGEFDISRIPKPFWESIGKERLMQLYMLANIEKGIECSEDKSSISDS